MKATALLSSALLPAVLGTACGPADTNTETTPATATTGRPAYVEASKIWRTLNIPVCWETSGWATEKGWVRDQIQKTWEASSDVHFTGWGLCNDSSTGVRILVDDSQPLTEDLGRWLDGESEGMVLNFTFQNWSTSCASASMREGCIRKVAAHEFGHALGFSHEQNRSDTPDWCDQAQGEDGTTRIGGWDADSIMNYCNTDWNNGGVLSSGDIWALRLFYGGPQYKGTKRAALDYGNGKIYFFNGMWYTRFDRDNMYVDEFYPKWVSSFWPGWPSTWSTGADAAVSWGNGKAYFFNGSSYLRYDMTLDHVDAGYPRSIAANWGNWPSTWTGVDAAINWGNGKAYFFRGSEYVRVTVANHTVDAGYPRPIAGNWPGVWSSGIEFVTMLDNGKAYFFKGSQYIRYDIASDRADPGYPNVITGNWPGVLY